MKNNIKHYNALVRADGEEGESSERNFVESLKYRCAGLILVDAVEEIEEALGREAECLPSFVSGADPPEGEFRLARVLFPGSPDEAVKAIKENDYLLAMLERVEVDRASGLLSITVRKDGTVVPKGCEFLEA
jgi:hypothetical protein